MKLRFYTIGFCVTLLVATMVSLRVEEIDGVALKPAKASSDIVISVMLAASVVPDNTKDLFLKITITNKSVNVLTFAAYPPTDGLEVYSVDDANKKTLIYPLLGEPEDPRMSMLGSLSIKPGDFYTSNLKIPLATLIKFKPKRIIVGVQSVSEDFDKSGEAPTSTPFVIPYQY